MSPTVKLAANYCYTRQRRCLLGDYILIQPSDETCLRVSAHLHDDTNTVFVVFEYVPLTLDSTPVSDFGIRSDVFYAWQKLSNGLINNLAEFMLHCQAEAEVPRVVYTGHGFGGALARLHAAVVAPTGGIITFDEPPCVQRTEAFDETYPALAKVPSWRVTADGLSPLCRWNSGLGYRHLDPWEAPIMPLGAPDLPETIFPTWIDAIKYRKAYAELT